MHEAAARLRFALAAAALLALWNPSARAEGSLGLDEVLQAVRGEPRLVSAIEVELRKKDLRVADVICIAARHGNHWKFLGAARAAPYECEIGDRTIKIDADRLYVDGKGRKLGQLGRSPDNVLFERARAFRESNFRWTWSP